MDSLTFTAHCLSFDEVIEQPHFEKTSFRVHKKIFATLDLKKNKASLKLSEIEQSVFCKQGWTVLELTTLTDELVIDALTCSYCNVAPKKLSEKYKD